MSPGRSIPLRYLTLLGAAGAVACGDASPTAPQGAEPPASTLALTAPDSAALASALDDIRFRIEPTLGGTPAVEALHGALARMSAAAAARRRAAFQAAVEESERALGVLASAGNANVDGATATSDLDAVRLVLLQASALLDPIVSTSSPNSVTP